ncbi:MAG TPA: type I DNA topoisomerase [Candidatus Aminicenantes bacterium]|nr:type I DNA topoisomerase [Candidatus Aminicenantes bacterium]HRY64085.1 type I DNA topoisomerase [Candidatus Aminicenantes bacterium]HRZ70998.1 type I DNA topoisomerase [Candidatus Aminicenantes bacterium]
MAKSLVIVESPAKAKTVNHYLGKDFVVKASMGHVRDLPKKGLGVDVEHDFEPTYEVIPDKKKIVAELRKAAKESERVILAADPDREGEAISWHLSQLLADANPNIFRASFHEITEEGVREGFEHVGQIDMNLLDAQQSRRVLDRLVGYRISPLLWKKIARGLSAGRVQSVTLRLIVDREREIEAFKPEEYWNISARLEAANPPAFKAALAKIDGKKAKVHNGEEAGIVREECGRAAFVLDSVQVRPKSKHPGPPYITSTLQQDGFRLLRFPVKKTMFVAQKLYEGMPIGELGQTGLITYMRTDSVRVSEAAQTAARAWIEQNYPASGAKAAAPDGAPGPGQPDHAAGGHRSPYVPAKPNVYASKKKTQDAHEAIRPAHIELTPEKVKPYLKKEEYDLYKLIWRKFMASQMAAARIEETSFDITAGRCLFQAKGEVVKFDGFLAVWPNGTSEKEQLPKAEAGETLKLLELETKQKFTEPPPRYTEGTLVKELESRGIGRPSTYAPTIATIQGRTYVVKDEGKFKPTELGMYVTDFLVKHFARLMDYEFTAQMEEDLDEISEGRRKGLDSLRGFYALLEDALKQGQETESVKKTGIPLDEKCPKCGGGLVIKDGRFGRFKACTAYPACKFRESLDKKESKPLDEKCPECGSQLAQKYGRFGPFVACSNYPQCKYIKKERPVETGIACPTGCGGMILKRKTRRGKFFFGCSRYPKCHFASWDDPIARACPECGAPVIYRKNLIKGEPYIYCKNEKCAFKEAAPREKLWEQGPAAAPAAGAPAPAAADKAPDGPAPSGGGREPGGDEQGNR